MSGDSGNAGQTVTKTKADRFTELVNKFGVFGTWGTFSMLGVFALSGVLTRFAHVEMLILSIIAWFAPGIASVFGGISSGATWYGWLLILRKKKKLSTKEEGSNEGQNQLANLLEYLGGFASQGSSIASTIAVGASLTAGGLTYIPEENVFGTTRPEISIERLSQLFEAPPPAPEPIETTASDTAFNESEMGGESEADAIIVDMTGDTVRVIHNSQVFTGLAAIDSLFEYFSSVNNESESGSIVVDMTGGSVRIIHNSRILTGQAAIDSLFEHFSTAAAPAALAAGNQTADAAANRAAGAVILYDGKITANVDSIVERMSARLTETVLTAGSAVEVVPVIYISESKTAGTPSSASAAYDVQAPPQEAQLPDETLSAAAIYQPEDAVTQGGSEPEIKPDTPQTAQQAKKRAILVSVRPEFLVVMGEMSSAGVIAEAGMVNENGFYLTADIGGGGNYLGGGVNVGYSFIPYGDVKSVVGVSGGFHNATVVHNLKSEEGKLLSREQGSNIGAAGVFVKLMPLKTVNLDITNKVLLGYKKVPRFDEGAVDFNREEGLGASYSIGVGYSIMKRGQ